MSITIKKQTEKLANQNFKLVKKLIKELKCKEYSESMIKDTESEIMYTINQGDVDTFTSFLGSYHENFQCYKVKEVLFDSDFEEFQSKLDYEKWEIQFNMSSFLEDLIKAAKQDNFA